MLTGTTTSHEEPDSAVANRPIDDWDDLYSNEKTWWETGEPCRELARVIDSGWISPCRILELGCGSGENAAFLASRGFDVTAIDVSIQAMQKAVSHADSKRVRVRFQWDDVCNLHHDLGEPFDCIFDRGCYHHVRLHDLMGYLTTLRKCTRLGSQFLCLAGRAGPNSDDDDSRAGPRSPLVTKKELSDELGAIFRLDWIEEFRFDAVSQPGPSGWSCLMNRRDW